MMTDLTTTLRERLRLADPVPVRFRRRGVEEADGFDRERIEYRGLEGDLIPAFLFTPRGRNALGGVVVFHQHNGEFHFGKSEVSGEVGDAFQAFGPALARKGLAVLAPDSITFEDRRGAVQGVEQDYYDWLQHYNAMSYRLLDSDTLMRKCLDDAQRALSVLLQATEIDERLVGVAGHSYGGYTALYHAAVDTRCRFACVSGAVCSFETRRREGTGITLFETVPGLARQIDTHDVLSAIGPRPTMVVSGTFIQDFYPFEWMAKYLLNETFWNDDSPTHLRQNGDLKCPLRSLPVVLAQALSSPQGLSPKADIDGSSMDQLSRLRATR